MVLQLQFTSYPEVARPSFHPTHRWMPWWSRGVSITDHSKFRYLRGDIAWVLVSGLPCRQPIFYVQCLTVIKWPIASKKYNHGNENKYYYRNTPLLSWLHAHCFFENFFAMLQKQFECALWTNLCLKYLCEISSAISIAFRHAVDSPQYIHPSWVQFHQKGASTALQSPVVLLVALLFAIKYECLNEPYQ